MNSAGVVTDRGTDQPESLPIRTGWGIEPLARQLVGKPVTFLALGWGAVLVLGAIDWFWASLAGISFTGWGSVILTVSFLAAIGLSYGYSGRNSRLAEVGNFAALWVAFSAVGSVFTYLAATMRMPLCDAQLRSIDAALGFHWTPWFYFVARRRYLRFPLALAYESMLPQVVFSILYFAHTGQTRRNRELLTVAMLSLVVTTLIAGLLPAVGPFIPGHQPDFAKMLLTIRGGAVTSFALDNMKGIVTLPSYHTVIAIALIWVHRPPSRSFPFIATISGLMLLAVPAAGNHYLSDMLAGAAIAAASIALADAAFREKRATRLAPPARA